MITDKRLDIVFEGGGARGLALNGAVSELERHGYSFGRLVGTSAGAITATLVSIGYTGDELRAASTERLASGASRMTEFLGVPSGFTRDELLSSTLGRVLESVDLPLVPEAIERGAEVAALHALLRVDAFAHVFSFVERGGLYSADGFLAWLGERLDAGGRALRGVTLAELHARTGADLSLMTSDTTAHELVVLNHRTAPDLPLLMAVRMSMSIPFVWPEVVWRESWGTYRGRSIVGHAMMDGGLVSNFALRFLVSDEPWVEAIMGGVPDPARMILGLTLDDALEVSGHASTSRAAGLHGKSIDRIERVFETAQSGNDTIEQEGYSSLVCALPTGGYGTLEFTMSVERIDALMTAAARSVDGWLASRGDLLPRVEEARAMLAPAPARTARPQPPSDAQWQ